MSRRVAGGALASAMLLAFAGAAAAASAPANSDSPAVVVHVSNPLASARRSETVVLPIADIRRVAPSLDASKTVVLDANGREILSQLVDMNGDHEPDDLVFQADLAPGARKTFTLRVGTRRAPTREEYRVYGRFVRERHDDFAWENDRIAHRMYGPGLETWAAEPLTSSGVDVWTKRVSRLVIDDWYMTDDYHLDHGEGADLYSVKKSRGCGGLGIYRQGKLAVSRNFTTSRVLASGPIRLVFELDYAPWDIGGARVSETKRVILDGGQSFGRFESTFASDPKGTPLVAGIGIAKHRESMSELDPRTAVLRSWEPLDKPNGNLGCAIIAPGATAELRVTDTDYLLVTPVPASGGLVYYAGFGWDRGAEVGDAVSWARLVESQRQAALAPLRIALAATPAAQASPPEMQAERMVAAVMARAPSVLTDTWHYDTGLVLKAIEQVALKTRNAAALAYVKRTIDGLVDPSGAISGYRTEEHNIDNINMGRVLFRLWAEARPAEKGRYRKAIELLRSQMRTQPRTSDGAFWHKKIYPHQMWLDGVYMASPFLAEYAATFREPGLFEDVATQILLGEAHMRDAKTGLLYHAWDERGRERWADPKTGCSSQFWGRAVGWYAMAVVDVLEWLPVDHPRRRALLGVLERLAAAIARVQDGATGVWWQVLDQPGRPGNYREASASSMFVYALAKAVRRGWLDRAVYAPVAARGYQGLRAEFLEVGSDGLLTLKSVCKVAGLGGHPYRDGSYAYYTGTEVVRNDPKGVGAFILAALESE